jgi:AraC-like DNA-binding protein
MFLIDTNLLPRVRFLGSVNYRKPWRHFSRTLDEYVLYIVKSGELFIREAGVDYALAKGDALLLEPGLPHTGTKAACCEYWFVHFKSSGIKRVRGGIDAELARSMLDRRKAFLTRDSLGEDAGTGSRCAFPKHFNYSGTGILLNISNILNESIEEYKSKYDDYKNLISGNLLRLIILLSREFITTSVEKNETHFPKTYIKATDMMNFIHREYRQKINSKLIEEKFENNYDYLNRVFHAYTGYPIQSYVNLTRINKAKELIASTPYKFMEICYYVGIENQYYFSRLFKKYTGMAPMQYLKIMRARRSGHMEQNETR